MRYVTKQHKTGFFSEYLSSLCHLQFHPCSILIFHCPAGVWQTQHITVLVLLCTCWIENKKCFSVSMSALQQLWTNGNTVLTRGHDNFVLFNSELCNCMHFWDNTTTLELFNAGLWNLSSKTCNVYKDYHRTGRESKINMVNSNF
jgi:hypothetical protein